MHPIRAQNAFLVELARVEKSQLDERILCTRIDFADAPVVLTTSGGRVTVPLEADSEALERLLEPALGPLDDPSEAAMSVYPSSGTLSSRWAELHYDLGRTEFLVLLDAAAGTSYQSLQLGDRTAILTLGQTSGNLTVEIDIDDYPVHAASEIGEAIDREGQI
ncbi:hypothetical protein [Plantibacter sp. CFBP 8804]|uniref:hypothetical protein n=1 Tax=Plantibacter sp. CFBP 8804 TaxID=2775270 RepID=UPI00177F6C04|nr:hypothetical protein [Plantibacter sp. CFBP 8804]MBD8519036.1 hypothetical protein [Plantibacter sp. CFBP 8804]